MGADGIPVSAQEMIIRRRKDRFIVEIVPNVPPETRRRPPVAAATELPDICQIWPALLLRLPLFHILCFRAETRRRPPVAAATELPDICQIWPALLLRLPLFHIYSTAASVHISCCCCCSSSSSRSSSNSSSNMQQHHAAAPCSSTAFILLLHLYLIAFFKFFSKLNIIFFSTIQYLSLLHYNTRCNAKAQQIRTCLQPYCTVPSASQVLCIRNSH